MRVGRVAVAVTAALLLVVPTPARATDDVVVFAHRGGAGLAPENTLGAFRQTFARFGDRGVWLELDTQLTADGHLVVLHDDTVDRTTTCSGDLHAFTLAALAPCDASASFPGWPSFEPIPTLRDVLVEGRAAGWRLMIEIKNIPLEANFDPLGTEVADELLALVTETGFPVEDLIVQSFWPLSLDRIERGSPALRTALLTSSNLPGLARGSGVPAGANMAYSALLGYEIAAPDLRTLDLHPQIVELGHALGRDVVTWTPNTPGDIARAIALGIDGVISDRPDLVYASLAP
ncbi:MAG TPA: glycerophosphodiester phosphodiesterase [Acidimicrobiales bacterium]|nr:glycerophosphodiester phosphodiesterase [Acidimicrobiales bacterium]